MKKKLLSLLLCVLLAFSLLPLSAFAADGDIVKLTGLEVYSDGPVIEVNTYDDRLDAYVQEKLTARTMAEPNAIVEMPEDPINYASTLLAAGQELRPHLKKHEATVTVSYQAASSQLDTWDEVWDAMRSIWNYAMQVTGDPMEGDYLRRGVPGWSASASKSTSGGTTYVTYSLEPYYWGSLTYAQEQQMANAANAVINSLGFTAKTSGYDKIKAIYDWIGTNIKYDYDALEDGADDLLELDQTAYSAIINRTTVCAGYSHLLYYMMWKAQIPARIIVGQGGNSASSAGNHAWNLTYLRGAWYSMDVTWDEGKTNNQPASHDWFLRSKSTSGFYKYHFTNRDADDGFDNTGLVSASSSSDYGSRRSEDNGACTAHTSASSYYTTDSGAVVHWCSKCGQSVLGNFGPVITTQPKSVSVSAGSTAKFTVAATGVGTLKYQWQWSADGTTWANTSLTGYNTATLSVTASSAVNGRYYRCVVSDSQGSATSNAAKLTVTPGPTITVQPKNRSAGIGTKATFTVAATGTGTLKYQWQWSADNSTWANTTLTGYNTASLTVTASASINGRYYRCVVSDDTGSVNSDAAKLFVTSPGIVEQPKAVSVTSGSKAVFTVKAMGTGTLTYQWQYSTNGTAWYDTTLTGYNTATLTVTASSAVNGRYYRCIVSDSEGSATSNSAKLTVIPGPTITAQPKNRSVGIGNKAYFTVAATGTGTLKYQWQYSTDGTTWNNTSLTGYNTATLTVTASSTINGRYYRCVVSDDTGSTNTDAARLFVTSPSITEQPKAVSVSSGSKAYFSVTAMGTGTLSYQWQWSADGKSWANTTLTGYNTATLTVTASSTVNGRYYRCVVSDSKGTVTSNAAKLTVIPGPAITGQPQNRTVGVGSKATFTVTATGTGTLKYQWQYSTDGTTWANTSLTGYNTKTLTVTASSAVNGRYYRCVVSDSTGSVNSNAAKLTVTSPNIIEQPKAVSTTPGSVVTFSVTAMGTGTLKYQWQYSTNGSSWNNTSLTGYNTATLTVTASTAVNGRYYRCVVSDSKGSVNSSAAKLTVVTGPTITGQPKSQTASVGSSVTFTVTATGTGTLTYQWQYSSDGTTWTNATQTGCNTAKLTVKASSSMNGKYFRCVVSDSSGSTNSDSAKLTLSGQSL